MSRTTDLVGRRFGKLTVIENTGEQKDRYWVWRCRCDCGTEIFVNTRRLSKGIVSHCGCEKNAVSPPGSLPADLTGRRYGKLTVLRPEKRQENGKSGWLCQCDCGNQCVVSESSLHYGKRKSCGCLHRNAEAGSGADLTGQEFGQLTVLEQAGVQNEKGVPLWKCRCACGTELNVSQDSLLRGSYKSCGCIHRQQQLSLYENLTFVGNTCVEVLERRKFKSNNTSGFRGVSRGPGGKWLVTIGMQSKRYYIGLYSDFDRAVKARLHIEEALHDGFVEAYQSWKCCAAEDQAWAEKNPFYFHVEKNGQEFSIHTVFGSTTVSSL